MHTSSLPILKVMKKNHRSNSEIQKIIFNQLFLFGILKMYSHEKKSKYHLKIIRYLKSNKICLFLIFHKKKKHSSLMHTSPLSILKVMKKKKKNPLTLHTETRYSLQHPNSHNPACTSTTHHRPYSRLTYRRLPAPLSTNLFNPVRLEEGTNLRTTISFVGRVERRGRGGANKLI